MSEEKRNILNTINSPDDLKKVPEDDLIQLCKELREKIIDECSEHPGHFGAGLGVVELTVALHYVFDAPYDNIVWDVGHQAYPHKILTGRRDNFSTNREMAILAFSNRLGLISWAIIELETSRAIINSTPFFFTCCSFEPN